MRLRGWVVAMGALLAGGAVQGQEGLGQVKFLEGRWGSVNRGEPGEGRGERSYEFVLRGRYLEGRNRTVYPPTEKSKGETHEDLSLFSFDKARGKVVLRQFHVEGFVNQYACASADGAFVCESEAIENIPAGWRARETWKLEDGGTVQETFELAAPGKEYAVYSTAVLKRKP